MFVRRRSGAGDPPSMKMNRIPVNFYGRAKARLIFSFGATQR